MGLIKCRTRNGSVRNALTKALLNVPDNTAMMRKGRVEDILHTLFLAVGAVRKDMECSFAPQEAPSAKVPSLSRADSEDVAGPQPMELTGDIDSTTNIND